MTAISEKIVKELPVPAAGYSIVYFSGAALQGRVAPSGFGVRTTSAGRKAFIWFHRHNGKKHLETIGAWEPKAGGLTVYDAIDKCIKRKQAIAKGVDQKGNDVDARPVRTRRSQDGNKPAQMNVAALIDHFTKRYLDGGNLRTAGMIKSQLDRLVKPRIGRLGIYEVKRSDISKMCDAINDDHGPRMADLSLAYIRKAFHWYELNGHDDDFKSPIVRGMARQKPSDLERDRILDDDEIRDLWAALDVVEPICFRNYVKLLLLTATRRREVADMTAGELAGDLWTIPKARYKTKVDHTIPLTAMARELIGSPKSGFVFSTTGGSLPISGFSKSKAQLDKALALVRAKAGRQPMEPWTFHDLRRTARSLMSRARVPTDHAERALGHVIPGVRGVYDRHAYDNEKKMAFELLAAMVRKILDPKSNVVPLINKARSTS